jgi:hypothetical protein
LILIRFLALKGIHACVRTKPDTQREKYWAPENENKVEIPICLLIRHGSGGCATRTGRAGWEWMVDGRIGIEWNSFRDGAINCWAEWKV